MLRRLRASATCRALLAAGLLLLAAHRIAAADVPAPAPSPAGGAPPPGCVASGPLAPRTRLSVSLQSGGRGRSFLLDLPDDFNTTQPSLLFALHGAGTSASNFLDGGRATVLYGAAPGTQLDAHGTAAGFVVATPQGVRGGAEPGAEQHAHGGGAGALAAAAASEVTSAGARLLPARRWSNDTQPGDRLRELEQTEFNPPDDIAFLYDVAACIRDGLRVPLDGRVFAAGWSQGGKLASALACADAFTSANASNTTFALAAVTVGAGLSAESCPASRRLPLLMLQGGSDDMVPFCRGGLPYKPGREAFDVWATARGCPRLEQPGGWTARCGGQGDGGDALRVFTPAQCATPDAAPIALYWLPKLPHDVPTGNLPGLSGGFGDLVVAFLRSMRDGGAPDTAPLRSDAPGAPPLAPCGGDNPCK